MESLKLLSGHEMPIVGLGTWPLKGDPCKQVVKLALELGYTHLDTACMYENHTEIGEALQEAGVDRSKLFITSKIGKEHLHYDVTLQHTDQLLRDLQTDYVDLLLVHWPNEDIPIEETMRAFNEIFDAGKTKSIGVSNFSVEQMERARSCSAAPISVNQIKYHPGHQQPDILQYGLDNNIGITAYSPLRDKSNLEKSLLLDIADKHNKTAAHVILKWLVQKGLIIIPKASSKEHLQANLDVFNWSLSEDQIQSIDRMAD